MKEYAGDDENDLPGFKALVVSTYVNGGLGVDVVDRVVYVGDSQHETAIIREGEPHVSLFSPSGPAGVLDDPVAISSAVVPHNEH